MGEDRKIAFITGITGQDGYYLSTLLLSKGYVVHGLVRNRSEFEKSRIHQITATTDRLFLHLGDLTDALLVTSKMGEIRPDEVYNLAAQSHVRVSFDQPLHTADTTAIGTLILLEAIKINNLTTKTKFYQASSSEMFGGKTVGEQTEATFHPRSPYAVSKVAAYWYTKCYRESYNMFAVNGILFNHESPERGVEFVTRKIVRGVSAHFYNPNEVMKLGNLDAFRDWGHARDYTEAMWLLMQHNKPIDLVIGTGDTHTVREFVELSYAICGIKIKWTGKGVNEIGVDSETQKLLVSIDPTLFRPNEVEFLLADPTQAKTELNWKARTTFQELVTEMMVSEIYRDAKNLGGDMAIKPVKCVANVGADPKIFTRMVKLKSLGENSIRSELSKFCNLNVNDIYVCQGTTRQLVHVASVKDFNTMTHLEVNPKTTAKL